MQVGTSAVRSASAPPVHNAAKNRLLVSLPVMTSHDQVHSMTRCLVSQLLQPTHRAQRPQVAFQSARKSLNRSAANFLPPWMPSAALGKLKHAIHTVHHVWGPIVATSDDSGQLAVSSQPARESCSAPRFGVLPVPGDVRVRRRGPDLWVVLGTLDFNNQR
jgi:hypothetical protein